jgi:WD40 repeat protein
MKTQHHFRLFVSSTFADFVQEREALQRSTFPHLRAYCERRGARFQPVDLRWGVSEDAALNQQTIALCLEEIRRCRRETLRPNFLALLGSRYGWRPLPASIPVDELESLLGHVPDPDRRVLLGSARRGGHYMRDANAVPPEYRLSPRHLARSSTVRAYRLEAQNWALTEQRIRGVFARAIERAGWAGDDPRRWRYEDSATHSEIREGALAASTAEGAALAYVRRFEREPRPDDEHAAAFIDLVQDDRSGRPRLDADASGRLRGLMTALDGALAKSGGVRAYRIRDHLSLLRRHDASLTSALEAFCDRVEHDLRALIDRELEEAGGSARLPHLETLAHHDFAGERRAVFVGRGAILGRIDRYVRGAKRTPLVVAGLPGSGKTALLANASTPAIVERDAHVRPVVIIRFVGATPRSTSLGSLLADISTEAADAYGQTLDVPTDLEALKSLFRDRVLAFGTQDRPLVLFVDALDQMMSTAGECDLEWLPRTLPQHSRVIISVLRSGVLGPDDWFEAAADRWRKSLLSLGRLARREGEALLDIWLRGAGRTLQPAQRRYVRARFAASGMPLFLKLAFEESKRWTSWQGVEPGSTARVMLETSAPRIIAALFRRLGQRKNHGPVVIRHAIRCLSASRYGLAEDELLDVLSADAAVMADFRAHSPTERARPPRERAVRLPWIVWSRLEEDLSAYLTRRDVQGAAVVGFYHREIGEVARRLFLPPADTRVTHRALSRYFREQADPLHDRSWRGVSPRGFANLPYHLAHAESPARLRHLVLDYGWLESKLQRLGISALLEDFSWTNLGAAAVHLGQTLQLAQYALEIGFTQLPGQLLGRLDGASSSALRAMLRQASAAQPDKWLRPLSRSLTPPGTGPVRIMRGHRGEVEGVALTPDEETVVSCGTDGVVNIWERRTGRLLKTLQRGQTLANGVAVTPDGRRVLAASFDKTVRIWDVHSERIVRRLRGHKHSVACVAVDSSGHFAITGSSDSTARVWSLESGQCLSTFRHSNIVRAVAFSRDGTRAFSASNDRSVAIWDPRSAKHLSTLPHDDFVFAIAVSRDGRRLISGSGDGKLSMWALPSGRLLWRLPAHDGFVERIVLLRGEHRAASCSFDHAIKIWDLRSGQQLAVLNGHAGPVHCLVATRDGRALISGSHDGRVIEWSFDAGGDRTDSARHLYGIRSVAVAPLGHRAFSATDDQTLGAWDVRSQSLVKAIPGHSAPLAISPDGRLLVSAGTEANVQVLKIVDLRTLSTVRSVPYFGLGEGHYSWNINAIAITPDGCHVWTASTANELKIWELSSGALVRTLAGHTGCVNDLRIASKASFAFSGSNDGTIRSWPLAAPGRSTIVGEIDDSVEKLAVTADGATVVSKAGREGPLVAWDTRTRTQLWSVDLTVREENGAPRRGGCYINDLCITPDDTILLVAAENSALSVRDLRTGELRMSFVGDTAMLACAVTPDGRTILSGERAGRLHFLRR